MPKKAKKMPHSPKMRGNRKDRSAKSSKSRRLFDSLMSEMEELPPVSGTWGKWKSGEGRQRIEKAVPAVIRFLKGHNHGPHAELTTALRADIRAFADKINIPNTTLRSYVQEEYLRHNGHRQQRNKHVNSRGNIKVRLSHRNVQQNMPPYFDRLFKVQC